MSTIDDMDVIDVEFVEEGGVLPEKVSSNLPDIERDQVDIEFDYTRKNIINIIEKSNKVLDNTAHLALESDHPRMVEVYSGLIKALSDVNKSLFEIREKKMKIKGEMVDKEPGIQKVVNNAIFVGSTEELIKTITKEFVKRR